MPDFTSLSLIQFLSLPIVAASCIIVLGSAVQSLTGFGFALVIVPLLLLVLDSKAIVPISLILGGVLNLLALLGNGRLAAARFNWPLNIGGLAGIPLGTLLLRALDPVTLRLLVGVTGIVLGLGIARGRIWHFRNLRWASIGVGVLSGALNSSTSMGGGPVALFLANQQPDKDGFRVQLLVYILLANAVALIALVPVGVFTPDVFWLSLGLVPATLFGLVLGKWLFGRLSAETFKLTVIGVVIATSAVGAVTAAIGVLQAVGAI